MVDTIGGSQTLKLEGHAPVLLRPIDTFRAQGISGANHVDQVPTTITALPFARIRVEKIAIQAVARHFIVKPQRVIAGTAPSPEPPVRHVRES